uniref:Uncharacterized protein n=1 Tax=Pyrodinium bahamense TaxID=73915 RepID=A0A7S0F838_9DINO
MPAHGTSVYGHLQPAENPFTSPGVPLRAEGIPGASVRMPPPAGAGLPYDPSATGPSYAAAAAASAGAVPGGYPQEQLPPMAWGGPEQEPVRTRVRIRLPRARFPGAPQFHGSLPKDSSTFAWPELCVTPDNEYCSMAPMPSVEKTWYNTVFYYPEQRSHLERQFLERFVPGPNGEWLDVVKARRMCRYFEEKREEEMREQVERQMLLSGSGMQNTGYTDAYSGEPLVACRGELASREAILEEHGIHRSATELAKVMMRDARSQSDFDNLRIGWPFGVPYRNKMISQHTYDWFDRNQNPYIPTDRSMEIYELSSMYVDREHFEKDLGSRIMEHRQMRNEAYADPNVKYVQM